MAIRPVNNYPGQTSAIDPTYPHGKAQNVDIPGEDNGTPLEEAWLNDLWGFQQALLAEAEIEPNLEPDKVGASQYLEALKAIIGAPLDTRLSVVEGALVATRTVHRAVPLRAIPLVLGSGVGTWERNHAEDFLVGKNEGLLVIDLAPYAPSRALITSIEADVVTYARSGTERFNIAFYRQSFEVNPVMTDPDLLRTTLVGSAYADETGGEQIIPLTPNVSVNGGYVVLKATASTPPAGDSLRGLRVIYTQSGL